MKNIGLYIHIPFCASKCPYCDFYSLRADEGTRERYAQAVVRELKNAARKYRRKADTLYLGGGTPSILGGELLSRIISTARDEFLTDGAEITVECNPHSPEKDLFQRLAFEGVNRISLGLQSADDNERKKLGRRADSAEIKSVIGLIKAAGIGNISLDVMLGIPDSTAESLKRTLDFCILQEVTHISGYILKIEDGTPFKKLEGTLNLPDEDSVSDMYLFMCDYLGKNGFNQYEISNFATDGFASVHNLKYWNCDEYLGIGAAAHSFIDGKRFCYPRDAEQFITDPATVPDGDGGDFEEYTMLRLRLTDGLRENDVISRYGFSIPEEMRRRAEKFARHGLTVCDSEGIRLTAKGFLVSNTVISELIY